ELIEVYDDSSSFEFQLSAPRESCGQDFDLQEGDVLEVRVVEQIRWDSCKHNVVELESQVRWELGEHGVMFTTGAGNEASIMKRFYQTTIEGCEGTWGFEVQGRVEPYGADGNPFVRPDPGGLPPVL